MTMEDKIKMMEEMMDLDEGILKPETVLEEIEEYDSFFKLYLTTYVKKNLDKRLTVAELESFCTVQDICEYLG